MKKIINPGNGTVIKSWEAPKIVRENKPLGKYYLLSEYATFYASMALLVLAALAVTVMVFSPDVAQSALHAVMGGF